MIEQQQTDRKASVLARALVRELLQHYRAGRAGMQDATRQELVRHAVRQGGDAARITEIVVDLHDGCSPDAIAEQLLEYLAAVERAAELAARVTRPQ